MKSDESIRKQLEEEIELYKQTGKLPTESNVRDYGKSFSGETSPYWQFVATHCGTDDGSVMESADANPDTTDADLYNGVDQGVLDLAQEIQGVMHLLSEKQREVIEALAEGLSERDAAEKIGMNYNTFSNHLIRARKKILESVGQNPDSDPYSRDPLED
jgi:hypothetical protein